MLRCFNDCFTMLLLYAAIFLLLRNRWTSGCVLVSLALSIKMNILLFMPALGVLVCQRMGMWRALERLLLMLVLQVALATPFLLVQPWNYLRMAFDFGRAFFYVWTVNLKVLSEETFLSPQLAKGLLALHLVLLVFFLHKMSVGAME
jgi:alpha-1,3-mannosyltransferase